MAKSKKFPSAAKSAVDKKISGEKHSTDNKNVIWVFTRLDVNGKFAFNLSRGDFDSEFILEKIITYNKMKWIDVKLQTHDRSNKSKNHFLDLDKLSADAHQRINACHLQDEADAIFSFALTNTIRIIGIRNDEFFYPIWYDPEHEFCPSKK